MSGIHFAAFVTVVYLFHSGTAYLTPFNAPEQVIAVPVNGTTIRVSWHLPMDYNYRRKGYKVFYTDRPSDSGALVMQKTVDSNTRETSIHNLKANTDYSIYVLALSDQGEDEVSKTVVVRTQEEVPGRPILTVKDVTSSSVKVQWQPPVIPGGIILGYHVHYVKDGKGHPISQLQLDPGMREVTISGLEPDTFYIVGVSAFSLRGDGPRAAMLIQTKKCAPPDAPKNVTAVPLSGTTVMVSWHSSKDHNDRIRGYKVFYTDRPGDPGTLVMQKTVDSNTQETSIDNLKANTDYSIHVSAFSDQCQSEVSESVVVRTHETVPGRPILTVKNVTSSSVNVQWQPPVIPGGIILGYHVHYVKDGKGHPISQLQLDPGMREVTISGLEPDTFYIVGVSAFSLRGDGPRAAMLIQTKRFAPVKMQKIQVVSVEKDKFLLRLERPSGKTSVPRHYHIVLVPDKSVDAGSSTVMENVWLFMYPPSSESDLKDEFVQVYLSDFSDLIGKI